MRKERGTRERITNGLGRLRWSWSAQLPVSNLSYAPGATPLGPRRTRRRREQQIANRTSTVLSVARPRHISYAASLPAKVHPDVVLGRLQPQCDVAQRRLRHRRRPNTRCPWKRLYGHWRLAYPLPPRCCTSVRWDLVACKAIEPTVRELSPVVGPTLWVSATVAAQVRPRLDEAQRQICAHAHRACNASRRAI